MTKLAGAIPNKLEDTRFIFMGNNSPEQMDWLQAKKGRGHIPRRIVAGHAFGTQIILSLVKILNSETQPKNHKAPRLQSF